VRACSIGRGIIRKYPGAIPFSNLKAHQSPAFNGHSHFKSKHYKELELWIHGRKT
jgi:hypothetical protein